MNNNSIFENLERPNFVALLIGDGTRSDRIKLYRLVDEVIQSSIDEELSPSDHSMFLACLAVLLETETHRYYATDSSGNSEQYDCDEENFYNTTGQRLGDLVYLLDRFAKLQLSNHALENNKDS